MPVGIQDRSSCFITAPDDNENSYLNPSLRGAQLFFGWMTWQSHPSTPSFRLCHICHYLAVIFRRFKKFQIKVKLRIDLGWCEARS